MIRLSDGVEVLVREGKMSEETASTVRTFLEENHRVTVPLGPKAKPRVRLLYAKRTTSAKSPTRRRLFEVMEAKRNNLCLAADVPTAAELLRLADEVGPEICMPKTHVDILPDFDAELAPDCMRLQ